MGVGRVTKGAGLGAGLVVLILMCLLSVWVGSRDISFSATWHVLWSDDGSVQALVIRDHRVPRTITGLLVGASLGLAGALMQSLTRNPLADPGLLGVEHGAAAAVVAGIAFLGVGSITGYLWFALAGALLASLAVHGLGAAGRAASPDRLVLAGAAISAVLLAFISAMLLLDPTTFATFRFWNVGSIAGRQMDVVARIAPVMIAGILLALGLTRPLNVLALGAETGTALGLNNNRIRVLGGVAITLLCGAATAAAGPIAFVGLTVPHVARAFGGSDNRWVFPYSMVLAPILLLAADVLGRIAARPGEVEVGIVTAVLGAPVFIALVRRRKLARL
ncbi:iron ABC transporter permease [Lentzea sp. NBRC 105346]|uniref:FecCD family ABC transporter permease n=1 Tax=Lentzea sp. NBRC 105346 TaxID=3032205 RepID=UPI0024A5A672|nr:iron chelate uptake ABC transporter family permease subunit [Lentzea sp. NBRC 105346]GLZ33686.1 iron ABC transporter permease [Lentzea sp. NBRC 105346]